MDHLDLPTDASEPEASAARAAAAAGIAVRLAAGLADLRAVVALLDAVWADPARCHVMPLNILRALDHAGGYTAVAVDPIDSSAGDAVIAASVGFLGMADGRVTLHSHITGTRPDLAGRGVGFALKLHQRDWAMDRGIATITWTFDPLVMRNAAFNLTKLGAVATAYYPDFYGPMDDAINVGDRTDRLLVEWQLGGHRAVAAARGIGGVTLPPPSAASLPAVIDIGGDGAPVVDLAPLDEKPAHLAGRIPRDATTLRREDPAAFDAWRLGLRSALTACFAAGYEATALHDGAYVLTRRF